MSPRVELRNEQSERVVDANQFTPLIKETIERVLVHLDKRPVPVCARALREEAACHYIGVDKDFLRRDRAEARRENRAPKFGFRKIGARVIYLLDELDRDLEAMPRVAGAR